VAFTQVSVSGTYRTADNAAATGAVVFTPTAAMRNGSTVVTASVVAQIVNGSISASLAATDDVGTTPLDVSYKVEEHITGTYCRRTYYLFVPHASGSIDLDEVAVSEEAPPAVVTYLTQAAGDARYEPLGGSSPGASAGLAAAMALVFG
jgi:hypothetical protein